VSAQSVHNFAASAPEITAGDWIQIVIAVVALFGGSFAGARFGALSRMQVEDRRRILSLASRLGTAAQPYRDLELPGRESFSLEYASPLALDQRAVVPIEQVDFVMDRESDARLRDLEAAEEELSELVALLPYWDRLSHRRFLRATAASRGLAQSLMVGSVVPSYQEHWIVRHRPSGAHPMTSLWKTSRRTASETGPTWIAVEGMSSFTGKIQDGKYAYRVGSASTAGGEFLFDGTTICWASAWTDFAEHLHRQLRPGRWRSVQAKVYRFGLLRDLARRRL